MSSSPEIPSIDPGESKQEILLVAEWLVASASSLWEIWDNEEDAIYDQLDNLTPRRNV